MILTVVTFGPGTVYDTAMVRYHYTPSWPNAGGVHGGSEVHLSEVRAHGHREMRWLSWGKLS